MKMIRATVAVASVVVLGLLISPCYGAVQLSAEEMNAVCGGWVTRCIYDWCPEQNLCLCDQNKPGYSCYCDSQTPDIACNDKWKQREQVWYCKLRTSGTTCTVYDAQRPCGTLWQCYCDTEFHECDWVWWNEGPAGHYPWSLECGL
jgi:hypothetical protein